MCEWALAVGVRVAEAYHYTLCVCSVLVVKILIARVGWGIVALVRWFRLDWLHLSIFNET